jgi:Lipid A 3-O-deacylase (PagL)
MKKTALAILLNVLIPQLKAQITNGLSLEANTSMGNIMRHSKRLIIPPLKNTIAVDIHANWQLKGQKEWHEWHGFPSVGASLMYIDLGNAESVGSAIGLFPTIDFNILRIHPLSISSQIGTGVGYLTKHYDQFDNPDYNAIGSHFNCMLHIKLRFEAALTPKIKAHLGGSFTHFSNGGARLPNFGVNIPAVEMGVRWMLDTEGVFIRHHLPPTALKKWGVNTVAGMALSANNPRGPKYPIYNVSVAVVRHFSKKNRGHLGVAYEQNRLIAESGLHAVLFATPREARRASERWMAYWEQEVVFGRVAMVFQTGVYTRKFEGVRNLWYNKLGLRVYMPPIGRPKTQFHAGFYLKAHLAAAEYIAFTSGASF